MGYNWEFDGSVDFAPPHYRKSKYEEAKRLGRKINDEKSALKYLEAYEYIKYLAKTHQIDNIKDMQTYEMIALSMLKSKEAIFKWITYPNQKRIWAYEFKHIRELEQKVINKQFDIDEFKQIIKDFNNKWKETNKKCKKYGFRNHTLYWIKDIILKSKIKEIK